MHLGPRLLRVDERVCREIFSMLKAVAKFIADERGATAIEYALIASGIFMAIIVVLTGVGVKLSGVFVNVKSNLS